ncbi:lytic murein transglycosylase [Dactylosporangium sp. NPDC005572]|uniref:lytic transglycosylase domain-containing protein n=1 Tax=Dactylosporangium sp. NPDC005572 TaxID=3156889 RepID=UPI0033A0E2BB
MASDDDRTSEPRDESAEKAGQPSTMDTLSVTAIRPPAPERVPDPSVPTQPHVPKHAAVSSGDVLESKQGRLAERREAVRTWAGRPGGRTMVVGAVILVMLALAYVGGKFIVPATAKPSAGGSPTATPAGTNGGGAGPETGNAPIPQVPTETPSYSPPPGTKERPADMLAVWAAPRAVKLDIPPVAMQAYGYAELITARTTPRCKLTWTTLAGIAKIESNHGRFNGALLQEDGKSVPTIIGPPLDGQSGRQAIRDTDQGALDTDKTWDRAVGAMQFLPSTWKQFGIDADNDGVTDVNDIDDAALTAAAYLCADGRDLSTMEGWNAAIHAYNVPEEYRAAVFNAANDYGRRDRTG